MIEQNPVEPVSWLRLERYHLGELTPEEAAEVERALAHSPETRACLDEIRKPVALSPMPEPPSHGTLVKLRMALGSRWPVVSFAVAAAAGVALFVWGRSTPMEPGLPSRSTHVKGGDVALALVREREGAVNSAPATFAEGDRFKVLLTCPPAFDGSFDVVVFQDDVASFPFRAPTGVVCGNGVPLPGAFTLTGTSRTAVCVTWAPEPNTRRAIEENGLRAVQRSTACVTLEPESR